MWPLSKHRKTSHTPLLFCDILLAIVHIITIIFCSSENAFIVVGVIKNQCTMLNIQLYNTFWNYKSGFIAISQLVIISIQIISGIRFSSKSIHEKWVKNRFNILLFFCEIKCLKLKVFNFVFSDKMVMKNASSIWSAKSYTKR